MGQLISAIWSQYLSLQGDDIEIQRQLLTKDKEIFRKEKEISNLKDVLKSLKSRNSKISNKEEFQEILYSHRVDEFIENRDVILRGGWLDRDIDNLSEAVVFGLVEDHPKNNTYIRIIEKGKAFFKWLLMRKEED